MRALHSFAVLNAVAILVLFDVAFVFSVVDHWQALR